MSRRRDEMLKEMGLWPVWRLRGATATDPPRAVETEEQAPTESGVSPGGGRGSLAGGIGATRSRDPLAGRDLGADHERVDSSPDPMRVSGARSQRGPLPPADAPLAGAAAEAPIEKGERSLVRPFPHHSARDRVRGASPRGIPVPPLDTPPSRPTVATNGERRERIMQMDWGALKGCVASCVDCELHARRTRTVFGVGDERASWLFVGEGPGADEDAQGEPFVGQAGKLLDSMLAAIRLRRGNDVYIANIVKCRPPGNRNPQPEEALACEPYLHRQIELIQPKLIIALGRVAAVNLLARDATIASLRGRTHQYRGIPLIVTYHPAYLLRNLPDKAKAWADLCFAVETMRDLKERAGATI